MEAMVIYYITMNNKRCLSTAHFLIEGGELAIVGHKCQANTSCQEFHPENMHRELTVPTAGGQMSQ